MATQLEQQRREKLARLVELTAANRLSDMSEVELIYLKAFVDEPSDWWREDLHFACRAMGKEGRWPEGFYTTARELHFAWSIFLQTRSHQRQATRMAEPTDTGYLGLMFDGSNRTVWNSGRQIADFANRQKAFEVACQLWKAEGNTVSREQLLRAGWTESVVEENAVEQAVSTAR